MGGGGGAKARTYPEHVADHSRIWDVAMESCLLGEANSPLEGYPVLGKISLPSLFKVVLRHSFKRLDFGLSDDLPECVLNL